MKETSNQPKLQIVLTETQAFVVREALEFYSRFLAGQIEALPDVLRWERKIHLNERARQALARFKAEAFPELHPNESYGIGWKDGDKLSEHRQIAYELYRQFYVHQTRQQAAEGKDVSWNVYSSPTLRYSNEPLIEIVEIKPEENTNGSDQN